MTDTIKELMEKYNEYREMWINNIGSDDGYDDWFTHQVALTKPKQGDNYSFRQIANNNF